MSLAKLPDELIAHLCSYLDYPDILNLMETSKKNYNAIKGYKKDKMEMEYIRCHLNNNEDGGLIYQYWQKTKKNNHYHKYSDDWNNHFRDCVPICADLKLMLERCSSVDHIDFNGIDLSSPLAKVLLETKTKIGSLWMDNGYISSEPEDFILLCKKSKGFKIELTEFNDALWNDQVLVSVLPHITLEHNIYHIETKTNLTDLTLEALVHNKIEFDTSGTVNKFTVGGILKAIKAIHNLGSKNVRLHFGILLSGQLEEAKRVFNGENVELRNICIIDIEDYDNSVHYKLSISPDGAKLIMLLPSSIFMYPRNMHISYLN